MTSKPVTTNPYNQTTYCGKPSAEQVFADADRQSKTTTRCTCGQMICMKCNPGGKNTITSQKTTEQTCPHLPWPQTCKECESMNETAQADGNLSYDFILQDLRLKRARLDGAIAIVQEFIAKAEAAQKNVCTIIVKPDIMEMLNEQA